MQPQGDQMEWISTGDAVRLLGFHLSGRTFRDKYRDIFPWILTPGGHFRWLRSAVEQSISAMTPHAS